MVYIVAVVALLAVSVGIQRVRRRTEAEDRVVIGRPAADVFAFVTDPRSVARWNPGVEEVEVDEGPMRAGAEWKVKVHSGKAGRLLTFPYEALEYEPGRLFVAETSSRLYRQRVAYELTPADGGTELHLTRSGKAPVFYPVGTQEARDERTRRDLAAIKQALEAATPGPSGPSDVEASP